MKLSDIKNYLANLEAVSFILENGTPIPAHFHVTEFGVITKQFIDCGGKQRIEKVANFQLWNANDFEHRLKPQKLLTIIQLSENILGMGNLEIEVEYQLDTISKYELEFNGKNFILISKKTACLAEDACSIPKEKQKLKMAELNNQNSCAPGGGCC